MQSLRSHARDSMKTFRPLGFARVTFLVGGAGTVRVDQVKVWENAPRKDWSERKAKLSPTTVAKL